MREYSDAIAILELNRSVTCGMSYQLKKVVTDVAREQVLQMKIETETNNKYEPIKAEKSHPHKKYDSDYINKRVSEIYQDIFNKVMSKMSIDWKGILSYRGKHSYNR